MASSVSFCMMPNSRSGSACSEDWKHAQLDADETEEQAAGAEAEGHRETQQQEDDQPREHDRGEVLAMNSIIVVALRSAGLRRRFGRCGLGRRVRAALRRVPLRPISPAFCVGSGPTPAGTRRA
jgi:hypothetical protein